MTASLRQINFRCGHFQSQQWEYNETASWVSYHEQYVIRSIPLRGEKVLYLARMISLDDQLRATARKKKKKSGTLVVQLK